MTTRIKSAVITILMAVSVVAATCRVSRAQVSPAAGTSAPTVLGREEAAGILPPSVFFRGQSAPIQGRNSAGLRFSGGKLVLMAVVDTSGYSSAVQQRYQAYLLTEVPLAIGGQRLGAGAYGFGFIEGNRMVVMDIGATEVLQVPTTRDEALARPNPLQILPERSAGGWRLYLGRSYVRIAPAEK